MARSFDERRRTWLRLLMGAGVAGGALPRALAPLPAWAAAERPSDGVYRMDGTVTINGTPTNEGLPVVPGDVIKTGADGRTVIVLGEHAFLLQKNTEVQLFGGVADDVLTLLTGRMLSVFGEGKTTIQTPFVTIGIRGTAVYVESGQTRDYVCVCYGEADLAQKQGGQHLETVKTTHHENPRYIYPPGGIKRIEKAKVINHTDQELIMLEWLNWRRPPFYDDLPEDERSPYTYTQ